MAPEQKRNFGDGNMPDLRGLSVRNALRLAQKGGVEITVLGSGVAVSQSPDPGSKLDESKKGRVLFRPSS